MTMYRKNISTQPSLHLLLNFTHNWVLRNLNLFESKQLVINLLFINGKRDTIELNHYSGKKPAKFYTPQSVPLISLSPWREANALRVITRSALACQAEQLENENAGPKKNSSQSTCHKWKSSPLLPDPASRSNKKYATVCFFSAMTSQIREKQPFGRRRGDRHSIIAIAIYYYV